MYGICVQHVSTIVHTLSIKLINCNLFKYLKYYFKENVTILSPFLKNKILPLTKQK